MQLDNEILSYRDSNMLLLICSPPYNDNNQYNNNTFIYPTYKKYKYSRMKKIRVGHQKKKKIIIKRRRRRKRIRIMKIIRIVIIITTTAIIITIILYLPNIYTTYKHNRMIFRSLKKQLLVKNSPNFVYCFNYLFN